MPEDGARSAESQAEAERRYEGAVSARGCKAEVAHSMVVAAFRTEVEETQARTLELEAKAEDLDDGWPC